MDATIARIVTIVIVVAFSITETSAQSLRIQELATEARISPPVVLASYRTRAKDPLPQHAHPSAEPLTPPVRGGGPLGLPANAIRDELDGDEAATEEPEEEEEEDESATALLAQQWHQLGPFVAEYFYTSEVFNNARGGISTRGATRFRGNFDLTLKVDTAKANWWCAGQFYLYAQHSHGTTLTPNFVGDGQYYSNIDTGPKPQDLTQLGEYWYEHTFADESLSVRIGRQDANSDFAYADFGADFLNSSFVTLPNIPMPFWPFQTLGVSARYQANEQLRLGGGIYDNGRDIQQWWVTTTSRGMFCIGQADYQPFIEDETAAQTLIRFGIWCTNSDTLSIDGNREFEGNYGFYATVDQMLLLECDDAEQGLGMFVQFSWAPPERNQVPIGYGAGLIYRGWFEGRDEDTIGAGFTLIDFSSGLQPITGQTYENAIELFYKAQLRDWLAIQPDLQYIVRPSGTLPDALVVGVRFEANF